MWLRGIWTEGGFTFPLLQGRVGGVKYCWNRCSSNSSFRNKFNIVLPCCLLVDNNTLSKMCVFKSRTGYTDDDGYENRNACVVIIIKSKSMKSLCWLF